LHPKWSPKSLKKRVFATFGGVRFRGRILDGILDDFGMRKPLKTQIKHNVFELFDFLKK